MVLCVTVPESSKVSCDSYIQQVIVFEIELWCEVSSWTSVLRAYPIGEKRQLPIFSACFAALVKMSVTFQQSSFTIWIPELSFLDGWQIGLA